MVPTFCAFTASSVLSVARPATNQQTKDLTEGGDTSLSLYSCSCIDCITLVQQRSMSL
jgi:hypothetical protein